MSGGTHSHHHHTSTFTDAEIDARLYDDDALLSRAVGRPVRVLGISTVRSRYNHAYIEKQWMFPNLVTPGLVADRERRTTEGSS